jgi:hypothetical protein
MGWQDHRRGGRGGHSAGDSSWRTPFTSDSLSGAVRDRHDADRRVPQHITLDGDDGNDSLFTQALAALHRALEPGGDQQPHHQEFDWVDTGTGAGIVGQRVVRRLADGVYIESMHVGDELPPEERLT